MQMCARFVFQLNGPMETANETENIVITVMKKVDSVVDGGMCVVVVVPRYKCPICHTEVWLTSWHDYKGRRQPKKCARCCRLEREARQLRKLQENDEVE